MNKVILIGNVGKDPAASGGKAKGAYFTVATSERWKPKDSAEWKERVTWHNIQVWGPKADFIMKYIYKGCKVAIEGKISVTEYNDKTYHNIIAENVIPLSPKREARPAAEEEPGPPPGGEEDERPSYESRGENDLPF